MVAVGIARLSLVLALLCTTTVASAQYIYLDTNGDGSNTPADNFACSGSTTLDIWLDTAFNRDGSLGVCPTGNIYSYQFIVRAGGGIVEWGGFTNALPGFTSLPSASNATDYHAAAIGPAISPLGGGKYKLGSLTLTVKSGCAGLTFAGSTQIKTYYATSLGSNCVSQQFDNTMRLGEDWQDVGDIAQGSDIPEPWYRVPFPYSH